MNRRDLLTAAPALALAGAAPAAAAPLVSLWREAEAIKAILNHPAADMDSPEWEAGYDRLIALHDEITARRPDSALDWAAKVANADDGGMFAGCSRWAGALAIEARALIEADGDPF